MNDKSNSYRYERKLIVDSFNFNSLKDLNNLYDLGLGEIYKERRVNSIYYDTNQFFYAKEHLDGANRRLKCRVRFYGNIRETNNPFLEFKLKSGSVGNKYKIHLDKNEILDSKNFLKYFLKGDCMFQTLNQDMLSMLYPKLFVTYLRTYYLSKCMNFRFTFDREIKFYLIENTFFEFSKIFNFNFLKFDNNIIEIKYESTFDQGASAFTNKLPFRLTNCSKYIMGLRKFGILE